jgi:predicted ATP-grasp superfamily ATP-dependent carboligase
VNDIDNGSRTSLKGAILLGGAHGSLAIARSLGRRGIPVWLITADNPLASLSRYVNRSLYWRGPRAEGALDFLMELGAGVACVVGLCLPAATKTYSL